MKIFKIDSYKKGFTLIELLVVVAIISLLSSIVITNLESARIKARNVKRISDVEQIRNALFLAFDGSEEDFPISSGWGDYCIGLNDGENCWGNYSRSAGNTALTQSISEYLSPIPVDPSRKNKIGDRYLYINPGPNAVPNHTMLRYGIWTSGPNVPYIVWIPEITPVEDSDCFGMGFVTTCGDFFDCTTLACALPLE